jgi:phospholipid transport system substrate-binding protein
MRTMTVLAMALALAGSGAGAAGQEGGDPKAAPKAAIEQLNVELVAVLQQAGQLGYQGRYDKLQGVLAGSFDLPFMGEKVVGRHWKELSPADQQRWLDAFERYTTANYAGRFTKFTGQRFETLDVEDGAGGTKVVKVRIVDPGKENVDLTYRLHQVGGQWKVIDVFYRGTVSEMALRRSEYSAILQRDDLDALIAALEGKISDLQAGKSEG